MKRAFAIVVAFTLALCMPVLAFGAGGNGSGGGGGNGSGGGSGEPLEVTSASIEDGAQINADDSITLVFSKNVCEAGVRDTNMALASVKDAQEAAVPITVVLADDQVEPDKKNDMVITFDKPLAAGEYTLVAQAGIASKSGDVLAEDYVLHFSVAPQEAAASASASAASASASASSASASAAAPAASSSAASQQGGSDLTIPIIIGVVVIAAIIGAVVLTKRKK